MYLYLLQIHLTLCNIILNLTQALAAVSFNSSRLNKVNDMLFTIYRVWQFGIFDLDPKASNDLDLCLLWPCECSILWDRCTQYSAGTFLYKGVVHTFSSVLKVYTFFCFSFQTSISALTKCSFVPCQSHFNRDILLAFCQCFDITKSDVNPCDITSSTSTNHDLLD